MCITVCKFGGSSLCDANMFARVLDIIRVSSDRRYIVLSAPGKRFCNDEKITDLLYAASAAKEPDDRYIFSRICERYASICQTLHIKFDLDRELEHICSKLHADAGFAASRGEYLCARIFAAYSGYPFVDAADLIVFDSAGNIDCSRTFSAIRNRLYAYDRAVIPGFYGSDCHGNIRTLPRGGSDVSGALIAAAVNAGLYENWTDVDGLYSADPCLVTGAVKYSSVSLEQMHAITEAGANVLHPDSLEILRGKHIDTVIKNTYSPQNPGTCISEDCRCEVCCITGKRRLDATAENAAICVFGADSTAIRRICEMLTPIDIIHMRNHYKIIIRGSFYDEAIRIIHQILIR